MFKNILEVSYRHEPIEDCVKVEGVLLENLDNKIRDHYRKYNYQNIPILYLCKYNKHFLIYSCKEKYIYNICKIPELKQPHQISFSLNLNMDDVVNITLKSSYVFEDTVFIPLKILKENNLITNAVHFIMEN